MTRACNSSYWSTRVIWQWRWTWPTLNSRVDNIKWTSYSITLQEDIINRRPSRVQLLKRWYRSVLYCVLVRETCTKCRHADMNCLICVSQLVLQLCAPTKHHSGPTEVDCSALLPGPELDANAEQCIACVCAAVIQITIISTCLSTQNTASGGFHPSNCTWID